MNILSNIRRLLFLVSCALSLHLSAQETFFWTLISDLDNGNRYEMYNLDFFSGDLQLLFTIDESRFSHANMTGTRNLINSFEYTADRSAVFFMEEEGDLYQYGIASDNLVFIEDLTPAIVPTFFVHFYTEINKIFFLNDSILYASGFTYGRYNINTGDFDLIRQPIDHPTASTPYELDLDCTEITRHKGDYLYISNSGKLMRLDPDDPDNNTLLYDYFGIGAGINHGDIVSYQHDCDSTKLYLRVENSGFGNGAGWYSVDLDSGNLSYSHPRVGVPNSILTSSVRHYNNPIWEDCQRRIDLDADDSTTDGVDFLSPDHCQYTDLKICDDDIDISNEYPLDSIVVVIENASPDEALVFAIGNYSVNIIDNSTYHIINSTSSTIDDFRAALLSGRYNNTGPPPSGDIVISVAAWYGGVQGRVALAMIDIVTPRPYAGVDVLQDICTTDVVDLYKLIDSDADQGGFFIDDNEMLIDHLFSHSDPDHLFLNYVSQNLPCADTSLLELYVHSHPPSISLSDTSICYGSSLSVDLSSVTDDIEWWDGSQQKIRSFGIANTYSFVIRNNYGCETYETFELNLRPSPDISQLDVLICEGDEYEFFGQFYNAPGQYTQSISDAYGCDSIIYDLNIDFYDEYDMNISGELSFCEGEITMLDVLSDHSDILINGINQSLPIVIDTPGNYTFTGIGPDGCYVDTTFTVSVNSIPSVSTSDLIDIPFSQGLNLPVEYSDDVVSYLWSPSEGLNCSNCPFPVLSYQVEGWFTILVENQWGCTAMKSLQVSFEDAAIYIPNVIASRPTIRENGILYIQSNHDLIYDILVFDRWGNRLFSNYNVSSNDSYAGWEPLGTLNPGVYVYVISYISNGKKITVTGDITLL